MLLQSLLADRIELDSDESPHLRNLMNLRFKSHPKFLHNLGIGGPEKNALPHENSQRSAKIKRSGFLHPAQAR